MDPKRRASNSTLVESAKCLQKKIFNCVFKVKEMFSKKRRESEYSRQEIISASRYRIMEWLGKFRKYEKVCSTTGV